MYVPSSASSRSLNVEKSVASSWFIAASCAFCAALRLAPLRTKPSYVRVSRRSCLASRPRRRLAVVQRLDALEELLVELDLVEGGRNLRLPFLVERLIFRRRHIVGHHREDVLDPAEPLAGLLERLDGVVEGRRCRIVGDRGDLAALLFDRELEGRREELRDRPCPTAERRRRARSNRRSRMLFGTATEAAAGADAPCAFATVPSAAMESMAVVASSIFIITPRNWICPAERIADEPRSGKRDFDERHDSEPQVNRG